MRKNGRIVGQLWDGVGGLTDGMLLVQTGGEKMLQSSPGLVQGMENFWELSKRSQWVKW